MLLPQHLEQQSFHLIRVACVRQGNCQLPLHQSVVISIDWHQVLDVKNHPLDLCADRVQTHSIFDFYCWKFEALKQQGAVFIINSYTCSAWYISGVHSVAERHPGWFDLVTTAGAGTGVGGKLWTPCSILDNHPGSDGRVLPMGIPTIGRARLLQSDEVCRGELARTPTNAVLQQCKEKMLSLFQRPVESGCLHSMAG